MPLERHEYLSPEGELGLWKIEENQEFFLNKMDLSKEEKYALEVIKGQPRKLEWLSGRWLLHIMSGRKNRGSCYKDEHGKPHLENSLFDISISHSHGMAAVIAAPRSVGIDIQKIVSKIERIAHKFMRAEEMASLKVASRLPHLHVYWGVKEALYKAYGRRKLDFKLHILAEPFEYNEAGGACRAKIIKDDFYQEYILHYERFDNYILVHGMEDLGDLRWA